MGAEGVRACHGGYHSLDVGPAWVWLKARVVLGRELPVQRIKDIPNEHGISDTCGRTGPEYLNLYPNMQNFLRALRARKVDEYTHLHMHNVVCAHRRTAKQVYTLTYVRASSFAYRNARASPTGRAAASFSLPAGFALRAT